jgi:peroxiredoxin
VISVGAPAPDARVWLTPNDDVQLADLAEGTPYLLLFYLFDWSST